MQIIKYTILLYQFQTFFALLQVHVHIKRHLMKDLPEKNEAVAQWCKDVFLVKVVLFFLMH